MGPNQWVSGTGAPVRPAQNVATAEARLATQATRKYCMKATSLASAPNSPAMITIVAAPPGQEPQMLVVAGNKRDRLIHQPRMLAAARIEAAAPRMTGQSSRNDLRIAGVMLPAMKHPMILCAPV